jgi:hypothetical protein
MKYDASRIIQHQNGTLLYAFDALDKLPVIGKYDAQSIKDVIESVALVLPGIQSDVTYDAQTLLHHCWYRVPRDRHRAQGLILRHLIDNGLIPLVRIPKGSGTRIRFELNM